MASGKWYMDKIIAVGELYAERIEKKAREEMAAAQLACDGWGRAQTG